MARLTNRKVAVDGGAAVLPNKRHQEAEADQQHGHHLDGTDVSQGVEDGLNLSSHGDSDHRGSGWVSELPQTWPPLRRFRGPAVDITRSYATPAADVARSALRSDPAIVPLLRERYWGPWPKAQELLTMPPDSLGHRYATWFAAAGGQPLPDPVLDTGTDGDDTWLHQRVRHTHDLWHVVCGCPPTDAGEAALSAINVMQLRLARQRHAAGR